MEEFAREEGKEEERKGKNLKAKKEDGIHDFGANFVLVVVVLSILRQGI